MLKKRPKVIIGIIIAVALAAVLSTFAMAAGPTNNNGFGYKVEDCPNKVDCYPCDGIGDSTCPRDFCPSDRVCDRPCARK